MTWLAWFNGAVTPKHASADSRINILQICPKDKRGCGLQLQPVRTLFGASWFTCSDHSPVQLLILQRIQSDQATTLPAPFLCVQVCSVTLGHLTRNPFLVHSDSCCLLFSLSLNSLTWIRSSFIHLCS